MAAEATPAASTMRLSVERTVLNLKHRHPTIPRLMLNMFLTVLLLMLPADIKRPREVTKASVDMKLPSIMVMQFRSLNHLRQHRLARRHPLPPLLELPLQLLSPQLMQRPGPLLLASLLLKQGEALHTQ